MFRKGLKGSNPFLGAENYIYHSKHFTKGQEVYICGDIYDPFGEINMAGNEEKNEAIAEGEEHYVFSKEFDEQIKKSAEQLARILKDPKKAERIQEIIKLELSGEIGALSRSNLMKGISANVGGDDMATVLILRSIEGSNLVDRLPELDISEDITAFLKDLNLLYSQRAQQAYNYSERKEDWIRSHFEVATTKDKELIISMELIKGSGEVVRIEGEPFVFLNLLGNIIEMLSQEDLTDEFSEKRVNEFEKDVNTLINKLKGKETVDNG